MTKIILKTWREGLQKVSLTKLQVEILGKSLKESKSNVDALLNQEEVSIEIEDLNLARLFLEKATDIGVECELISS
jgi:hypothetical protein